jgi:hypothetical protein
MQRTFNYTNRTRLLHQDVRIALKEHSGKFSFDAVLELTDYGLPTEALVFLEAYRQTVWMRFEWGTVGALVEPTNRVLSEFDSPEDILFRVRITSPGTKTDPHGLLLAEADRVRLRSPDETADTTEPLLPVVPFDLGHELWRVDFDQRPRLLLNRLAGDYKQIGHHPAFVAAVYPAAMREILINILLVQKHRDFDDPDDPLSRWLRFGIEVLAVGEPPLEDGEEEAMLLWVGEAVAAFSRKHRLLEKFQEFWTEEEQS